MVQQILFMDILLFSFNFSFYEEEPVLGVVKHISSGEIYYATKQNGAFCNNKKIFVSKTKYLSKSLLATGFGYKHEEIWEKI